jgi:hypothetical protein
MKRTIVFVAIVASLFFWVGTATALPFSVTVDFDEYTLPGSGRTVALLIDSSFISNVPYEFSFELDLDPVGVSLNSASLSLSHWGNSSLFSPAVWISTSKGGLQIGELSPSGWGVGWVTDTFILDAALLAEIESTDPWSLTVVVSELTDGFDFLLLDEATLSGNYTPIPVPTSLLLLGSGLLGLLGIRRRKWFV